ncbi:MAG TPA: hypothetical protein VN258_07525 [Mobilitalea sp.]|nr:hypothetical protein [Mobilitalea sp.]
MQGIGIQICSNPVEATIEMINDAKGLADEILTGKCLNCEGWLDCKIPKDKAAVARVKEATNKALAAIEEFTNAMTNWYGLEEKEEGSI